MLAAGHETITNLIGNSLLVLLQNPSQLDKLRARPELIKNVILEVLRYESPIQVIGRTATRQVKFGTQLIQAGQTVALNLGGANHDPAQYAQPDQFDIFRTSKHHMAFGYGMHYCLGAPLARLETQIAISTILQRYPAIQISSEPLEWHRSSIFRGLKKLKVNSVLLD